MQIKAVTIEKETSKSVFYNGTHYRKSSEYTNYFDSLDEAVRFLHHGFQVKKNKAENELKRAVKILNKFESLMVESILEFKKESTPNQPT